MGLSSDSEDESDCEAPAGPESKEFAAGNSKTNFGFDTNKKTRLLLNTNLALTSTPQTQVQEESDRAHSSHSQS